MSVHIFSPSNFHSSTVLGADGKSSPIEIRFSQACNHCAFICSSFVHFSQSIWKKTFTNVKILFAEFLKHFVSFKLQIWRGLRCKFQTLFSFFKGNFTTVFEKFFGTKVSHKFLPKSALKEAFFIAVLYYLSAFPMAKWSKRKNFWTVRRIIKKDIFMISFWKLARKFGFKSTILGPFQVISSCFRYFRPNIFFMNSFFWPKFKPNGILLTIFQKITRGFISMKKFVLFLLFLATT